MRSPIKASALVLGIVVFALQLVITGCGSTTKTTFVPPTVSSVTMTGAPTSMKVGDTANPMCTGKMSDGTPTPCTISSSKPAVASYSATTGKLTAMAAGTTSVVATANADSSVSSTPVSLTVTAVVAITITSVTATATPATITTAQTSQCAATVTGTGAFSSAHTWTATGGTISSSGLFTPTASGPATCTATSTADSTKSGSANITVTQAPMTITSIGAPIVYSDSPGIVGTPIYGTGFHTSAILKITAPGSFLSIGLVSSTEVDVALNFGSQYFSPGWYGFTACEADGTLCSNTMYFAMIGNQNTLSKGLGELYQNDLGTGFMRKFKVVNGTATADGSFANGLAPLTTAIDDKTGYNVGARVTDDANGNPISMAADDGNGDFWIGQDANNGISCGTRHYGYFAVEINLLSCFPVGVANAQMYSVTLSNEPWTVAMATLNNKTHALTISRKTTPTLWDVDATNSNQIGSYPLTGFTDSATIQSTSLKGGWELAAFENGSATGTVAALSNFDKLIVFINVITKQQIGQPVILTGEPIRMAKDEANGNVVVAFADLTNPAKPKSTFASVNPTTGMVTPHAATSLNLATGFSVSSDGKYLYVCNFADCKVIANQ